MCGIAYVAEENAQHAENMLKRRGIRTKKKAVEQGGALIGRRLPIQGLDTEYDSPYSPEDSSKAWLFSGEVYNYQALNPKARSDIEVITEKVSESEKNFKKFDGMWSLICHDPDEKTITAYTDFLCKKPLYFTLEPFQIASEIKALYSGQAFNMRALSHVLKFGYFFDACETPFEGIYKMPEASKLEYNLETKEVSASDVESMVLKKRKFSDTALVAALMKATRNRLVSDVRVSMLLSGGVDSAILAGFLQSPLRMGDVTAFHLTNTKEQKYLKILEKKFHFKARRISSDYLQYPYPLMYIPWPIPFKSGLTEYSDTPYDLGSLAFQFRLGHEVRSRGFNVAISGDGADEVFGGYSRLRLFDTQVSDVWDELVHYHLPRLDCMMLQNTVELRCPFLARSVVELGLSMPWEERIDKKALREIFAGYIPEQIQKRGKTPLRTKMPADRKEFYAERIRGWMEGVKAWRPN